ncbi:MAG: twin-arginine translocase subunit TatC [Methylohalobius sp.]|nr:twin-arginine translocase subunit TatC [Methylohalobius sp.]
MTIPPDPELGEEQPFIAHLIELRSRLLKIIAVILVAFVGLAPFSDRLYTYLAGPLLKHLPTGSSMIAIDVASPFLAPFKLALVTAIFATMPFSLYQMWAFVAPGLYRHERRVLLPLLVASTLLFYLGAAFAYFAVLPLIFKFMTATAPQGVAVMTDISRYLDFILTLFFAFGVAFEVPIATILAVWSGMTTRAALADKRPYVIVAAFVIGMILTPPDVVSQTLLAVPIWLLYELGLLFSLLFRRGS